MKLKDCLERDLIRKNKEAKNRVKKSLEIAKRFLKAAVKNLEIEEYDICLITSYSSLFHACRALLFNKGYTERSHFCLFIALRDLYKDKKLHDFLDSIDRIRVVRHEVQYRGTTADKEEADFVINLATKFLDYVKKLLL